MKVIVLELSETDEAGHTHWVITAIYVDEEKLKIDVKNMIEKGRVDETQVRMRAFEVIK